MSTDPGLITMIEIDHMRRMTSSWPTDTSPHWACPNRSC
jgi:hypothetical protein